MRFRTVLAILFFCVAGMAAGEHYDVRHYSIEDGLSQNTVMTILQDKQGYMWFGTWDGLNRFDGYSFKVFKAMDSNGKEARVNNRVEAIYEDANGCIWWKTYDNHYYMLDRSRSKVSNKGVDELPKEMIRKLAELDEVMRIDKHGIMWNTARQGRRLEAFECSDRLPFQGSAARTLHDDGRLFRQDVGEPQRRRLGVLRQYEGRIGQSSADNQ